MEEDKKTIFQMRFPQKLWYLLNMRTDAILWGGTGRTILLNYRVLHNYLQCDHSIFKTTNISSFVRQLNLYGFRKVTSHLQDPLCNSSNPYMHEYVHDFFQFGRPELLNKITRKALAVRKHFKAKNIFENPELYATPLQKARRALQIALRKAAQELFLDSPSKSLADNIKFESDENNDFCEVEEAIELDWLVSKKPVKEAEKQDSTPAPGPSPDPLNITEERDNSYREPPQDLINFNVEDESENNNDSFPGQFLSMPDLDAEPNEDNSGIELLAEFDIDHDIDQGIAKRIDDKMNQNSLNCVLPSISNDQNDDMTHNNPDITDVYQDGEWDQMFNDMMASRGSNQESASELKELYSQISRTIDLLNS